MRTGDRIMEDRSLPQLITGNIINGAEEVWQDKL